MTNFNNDYILLVNSVTSLGFALLLMTGILALVRKYRNGGAWGVVKILLIVFFFPLYLVYKLLLAPHRCFCGHNHPCPCACRGCQDWFLMYMD